MFALATTEDHVYEILADELAVPLPKSHLYRIIRYAKEKLTEIRSRPKQFGRYIRKKSK